jgi:hypothetical protein
LNDEGKLVLIHQKAEDAVYEKPGVVINTSCNETGPVFLTKLPDNMLCLLQARNNNENTLFPTEQMEDFVDYFPLETVYYTGKKSLEDPEVNYVRYMKIGRTGKKLDEELHTGGALGLPFPGTYEQEYDKFKSKGPHRITAMTNEALDSSYAYKVGPDNRFYFTTDRNIEYRVTIIPGLENSVEILFSSRNAKGSYDINMTGTGDQYKVMGTIVKIIKEYVDNKKPSKISFSALKSEPSKIKLYSRMANMVDSATPDYVNEKPDSVADEITFILRRKENISEALDSSYPYEKKSDGKYTFETEDGVSYKVYFGGRDLVEISFSAVLPGEEENFSPDKITLTGTGNSRKVFGTVVNIVKDFLEQIKPSALYFTGEKSEPSRIKLYDRLISQVDKALPNYYADRTLDLGSGKAYMLRRKDTNVDKALDVAFENKS